MSCTITMLCSKRVCDAHVYAVHGVAAARRGERDEMQDAHLCRVR